MLAHENNSSLVEQAVKWAASREPDSEIDAMDAATSIRWAHLGDVFGLGSTSAIALCRRFGLDPHVQVLDRTLG